VIVHDDNDELSLAVEDRLDLQRKPTEYDDESDDETDKNSAQRLIQH
jgi:hypothetical protein